MPNLIATAFLVGAFTSAPVVSFGATPAGSGKAATHATTGVVKSLNDTTLVISRPGKKGGDMTFALDSSTAREGTLAVGSPVSVRYHDQGKTKVATAITAQQPKHPAEHKASQSR
jgi:hypothetical protein